MEEIAYLVTSPPEDYVCKKVPLRCEENATFLIDTRALRHPNDWKADDLGAFNNVGKVTVGYFHVTESGTRFLSKAKPSKPIDKSVVLLKKTYWTHQRHTDFKRRCFEGFDNRGVRLPHLLVRYEFDDQPHPVTTKAHGNGKKSDSLYYRSRPSTLKSIKEKVQTRKGPSQVYDEIFEEVGGILGFESHADLPRNRQQVSDVRRNANPRRDKDEMCELIKMSRKEASESKPFIRRIQVTPEPACIVASDRQVNDLVRFCTTQFLPASVLCVDTTFNIGNFFVTPTTYKHSILVDRQYGKAPTMLGPTMIHKQTKAESFKYFGLSLVSLDADLSNILAIGSDRDVALRKGFSSSFPIASWLYCKGHLEQDIRRKIRELGISLAYEKPFLEDIFGSEQKKELGLVDAESRDEFDVLLESLFPVWTRREMEARQLSNEESAQFYQYFLKYVADDMKNTMIASIRRKVGYDDDFFFNNDPESMHHRIKTRMDKKKLTWPECVKQLKEMSEEQERNIQRALIDEGPYQVRPECRRLVVPVDKWLSMSKEQKERKLKEFQKMALSEAFGVRSSATISSKSTIMETATEGMPLSSGKKPGQSGRRGGRRSLSSPRDTTGFQPRITRNDAQPTVARGNSRFQPNETADEMQSCHARDTLVSQQNAAANEVQSSERQYTCTWIKDTKAYMCYGCDYPLRPKPTGQPDDVLPPAPFDVVLCRKELRMYKTKTGALTFSVQPQNVYYHLKKACVVKKNKSFTAEDLCVNTLIGLEKCHYDQLRKEFGFTA